MERPRNWRKLYLVVFGSWVGYTAYIWLLNHVPTSKVSTYAYVNPVVAVFLGWLVLHERVSGYIWRAAQSWWLRWPW